MVKDNLEDRMIQEEKLIEVICIRCWNFNSTRNLKEFPEHRHVKDCCCHSEEELCDGTSSVSTE